MIRLYLGKSGSGKNYYQEKLVACGVKPLVVYTTRPLRPGEQDGVDYHFVTEKEFARKANAKEFMEYRSYDVTPVEDLGNGTFKEIQTIWYYGTPFVDVNEDWVGITTISGAYDFIKVYGSENIDICLVDTNDKIREDRHCQRGGKLDAEWERRKKADDLDFSEVKVQELVNFYGKEIIVLHNNEKVTFGKIGPIED